MNTASSVIQELMMMSRRTIYIVAVVAAQIQKEEIEGVKYILVETDATTISMILPAFKYNIYSTTV